MTRIVTSREYSRPAKQIERATEYNLKPSSFPSLTLSISVLSISSFNLLGVLDKGLSSPLRGLWWETFSGLGLSDISEEAGICDVGLPWRGSLVLNQIPNQPSRFIYM